MTGIELCRAATIKKQQKECLEKASKELTDLFNKNGCITKNDILKSLGFYDTPTELCELSFKNGYHEIVPIHLTPSLGEAYEQLGLSTQPEDYHIYPWEQTIK